MCCCDEAGLTTYYLYLDSFAGEYQLKQLSLQAYVHKYKLRQCRTYTSAAGLQRQAAAADCTCR